jgi:hypothetical protein
MALCREAAHVVDVELGERAHVLARAIVEQGAQIALVCCERMRRESALMLELF